MPRGQKTDLSTVVGLAVSVAALVGGLLIEGGKLSDLCQLPALFIVCFGTLGATTLTTPSRTLLRSFEKLRTLFVEPEDADRKLISQIMGYAGRARKGGILSLEPEISRLPDSFFKRAFLLAIDGVAVDELSRMVEIEIIAAEERGEAEARVFEAAGGYAPTIGILGAVLGLIQVMKHLDNMHAVGGGIANAFVATIYGVALANLVLLPVANKLRARVSQSSRTYELILEGAISLSQCLHPDLVQAKLEAYLDDQSPSPAPALQTSPRSAAQSEFSRQATARFVGSNR